MSANMAVSPDRVSVTITHRLGFECWQVMRDARLIANDRRLPLHLSIDGCQGGDMGGLGSLLLAQKELGEVTLGGCNSQFASWFASIAVCGRCGGKARCAFHGAAAAVLPAAP